MCPLCNKKLISLEAKACTHSRALQSSLNLGCNPLEISTQDADFKA